MLVVMMLIKLIKYRVEAYPIKNVTPHVLLMRITASHTSTKMQVQIKENAFSNMDKR